MAYYQRKFTVALNLKKKSLKKSVFSHTNCALLLGHCVLYSYEAECILNMRTYFAMVHNSTLREIDDRIYEQ